MEKRSVARMPALYRVRQHDPDAPVLRPAGQAGPRASTTIYDWLRQRRQARRRVDVTSVELLRELYDEDAP